MFTIFWLYAFSLCNSLSSLHLLWFGVNSFGFQRSNIHFWKPTVLQKRQKRVSPYCRSHDTIVQYHGRMPCIIFGSRKKVEKKRTVKTPLHASRSKYTWHVNWTRYKQHGSCFFHRVCVRVFGYTIFTTCNIALVCSVLLCTKLLSLWIGNMYI